jgi:signal transduction histidine kinase
MSDTRAVKAPDYAVTADVKLIEGIAAVTGILDVVCRTTGMGFAAVARVTDEKWIACAVKDDVAFGLQPGGELPLETTICHEIRGSSTPVVFDDALADPTWAAHHTPRLYGLRSYISFPIIRANGEMFGTLCAIDPEPHPVSSPETREMFRLFAELIAFHIDAADTLEASREALKAERETAMLRDQFIAILGHDLRNPVASIAAGVAMLERAPLSGREQTLVTQMGASIRRIRRLIEDVLDFARGQLGGGIALELRGEEHIRPVIEQVTSELQQAYPERAIRVAIALEEYVPSDPDRIGQLLSNLLGNALTHGDPDHPVEVHARAADGEFALSVTNRGKPIPPEVLPDLFKPFTRASVDTTSGGLGLGLYIASKIAEAHAGELTVHSDEEVTRFTLRIASANGRPEPAV